MDDERKGHAGEPRGPLGGTDRSSPANDVRSEPAGAGDLTANGFGGRLSPGRRPAVLAIDMMAAYYTAGSPFCLPSRHSLDVAAEVLRAARDVGVPVLHTVVRFGPKDMDSLVFLRKIPALRMLTSDEPLGELMPEVAPLMGEPVLVKKHASAFHGTDLSGRLEALGVDTAIVVGVSTSGCVRATAVDAVQRNLIPLVVRDGVGDRPGVGEHSLDDLQAKYAEVISATRAVAYLRESAPTSRW